MRYLLCVFCILYAVSGIGAGDKAKGRGAWAWACSVPVVSVAKATPKTCSCSPACVCGCNEGKPCTCGQVSGNSGQVPTIQHYQTTYCVGGS